MSLVFDSGTEKWIQFARLKSKELEERRKDLRLPRLTRTYVVDITGTMIWIVRTEFMEMIRISGVGGVPWVWSKFVAKEVNFPTVGTYDSVNNPLPKFVFTAPTGSLGVKETSKNVHSVNGDQIEWSKDRSTIVNLNSVTGIATIIRGDVSLQMPFVVSMKQALPRVLSSYYKQEHAGLTKTGKNVLLASSDTINAFFWLNWNVDHFNVTNIPLPEIVTVDQYHPAPRFFLNPFTGEAYVQIRSLCPLGELGQSDFWKADIATGTLTKTNSLPSSWMCPIGTPNQGFPVGSFVYSDEVMVFEPTDKSAHVLTLQFQVATNDGFGHITYENPKILRDGVKYIDDANAGGLGALEFTNGLTPADLTFAILAVGDEGRILLGYFTDANHVVPGNPISSLWKWGPDDPDHPELPPSIKTFVNTDFKDPDHISMTGRQLIRYNTNNSRKPPLEMWQDGVLIWTPNVKDEFTANHILRISAKTDGVFECFDGVVNPINTFPPFLYMAKITKNKDDTWTLKRGQSVSSQFTALGSAFTRDLWAEAFAGGGLDRAPVGGGGGGGGGGG